MARPSERVTRVLLAATLGATGLAATSCAAIAGVEEGVFDPSISGSGGGATGSDTGTTSSSSSAGGGPAGTGGGSTTGAGGGSTGTGGAGACPDETEGMVEIPSGAFMMGCNSGVDVECDGDENPYHEVTLGCFLLDRFEVSRGDYFACVEDGTCATPENDWDPTGLNLQDHPVTFVTWQMADAYCAWAGKRLPTEAEWEKGARGTEGLKYPFGNIWGDGTPGGGDCSQANANLCRLDTEPVDYAPTGVSPYGLFNMGGNVEEWVADWYDTAYYAVSPAEDPTGPASGATKGRRGGSWNSAVFDFRTSARNAGLPDLFTGEEGFEVGFRCAK